MHLITYYISMIGILNWIRYLKNIYPNQKVPVFEILKHITIIESLMWLDLSRGQILKDAQSIKKLRSIFWSKLLQKNCLAGPFFTDADVIQVNLLTDFFLNHAKIGAKNSIQHPIIRTKLYFFGDQNIYLVYFFQFKQKSIQIISHRWPASKELFEIRLLEGEEKRVNNDTLKETRFKHTNW